ncbi:MAG: hypothetical protein ACI9HI_001321, partial [Salinirussus sp.]
MTRYREPHNACVIPMARLLMIVGDFGEDYELMVPFQALQ